MGSERDAAPSRGPAGMRLLTEEGSLPVPSGDTAVGTCGERGLVRCNV